LNGGRIMRKTLAVIHTGFVSVDPLTRAFADVAPGLELVNIVDDSLLKETIAMNGPTSKVVQRLCWYFSAAEQLGADAILSACSSVGEITEIAAHTVSIPAIRVDSAMAEMAVDIGSRIALMATVQTTLLPSKRLIERIAADRLKDVTVVPHLCSGAFELLTRGDKSGHDRALIEAIHSAAHDADVVVLAQVSMARLLDVIDGHVGVPVLASPMTGARHAARVLGVLNS